jgi:FKBP-type peptidyl-prolyl cis-trans isomerase (trigger factor)
MLTEINENYKKCIAENEAKINEIRAARADKLYDTVRIEIPAGLTNEEVKDILDKAYIRYITA